MADTTRCLSASDFSRRNTHEHSYSSMLAVKQCKKCGKTKPPECFSKKRAQCKPCRSILAREWYLGNPDKIDKASRLARSKAWQASNRDLVSSRARVSYRADPSKNIRAVRKWQRANLDRQASREAARRARTLRATPAWANEASITSIYVQARRLRMHVDHIVPLKSKIVCGLHCEANLQLLPASENQSKNNRHWPDMP